MKCVLTISLIILPLLPGCGARQQTEKVKTAEPMELGWINREDFMQPRYPQFKENYDSYNVDDNFVEMIQMLSNGVDIFVILGTWCSDSRRQVPRFLKITDRAGVSPSRITFYGVDRSKRSDDGVTEKHDITLVPTFIILKHGNEIGRIVESPKNTLEEDLLSILADAQEK